tara:strand:- start:417 stop:986 length:570 start_codon:yes stop_codon:yes gene_type:complete
MFIFKNNYFLIIESIKNFDLKNIKKRDKFSIIYRNNYPEKIADLLDFRRVCKLKKINFFIANNFKIAILLKADGVYLSSYNTTLKSLIFRKHNFQLIGSAHNFKEINIKMRQGCSQILLSKLFLVDYDKNAPYLGLIKFNNILKFNKNLIPLGGINQTKLNSLKSLNCKGIALLSEIKKKPANIINRLF